MGRQFKEQILWLGHVWDSWTEAERVVASYSVLQKLSPISTRFVVNLLEQNVQNDDHQLTSAEARANDPAWVSRIGDGCDGGTTELLHHLPLLRASSTEAKSQYLSVIPKVLAQTLSQPVIDESTLERARQLLSYSLVHPAISVEEKRTLGPWIQSFEDRLAQAKQLDAFETSCQLTEEELQDRTNENEKNPPEKDTADVKDASLASSSLDDKNVKSQWHNADHYLKEDVRWSYLETPVSPNHSGNSSRSSGSESMAEECHNVSSHPGMKDISIWLKSLRLHKYAPLLCNLAYDELLNLSEEMLESKGVTKGARHKIVLSVAKLRCRHQQLTSIEEELMNGGNIQAALNQLKSLIITPMLPHQPDGQASTTDQHISNEDNLNEVAGGRSQQSKDDSRGHLEELEGSPPKLDDSNLPSRFTRVMGKVCTQLLVCVRPEDESVSSFLGLVEKCLYHDAFSMTLKKRLLSWKQQVLTIWHPVPPRVKDARHIRRWSHQYCGELANAACRPSRLTHQRYSTPSTPQINNLIAGVASKGHQFVPSSSAFYSIQPSLSTLITPRTSLPTPNTGSSSLLSPQHFFAKRPSLQETTSDLRPHVTLQRTRSAPSRPNQVLTVGSKHPERTFLQVRNAKQLSPSDLQSLHEGIPQLADIIDPDITNRLESLCLSMTEHALG